MPRLCTFWRSLQEPGLSNSRLMWHFGLDTSTPSGDKGEAILAEGCRAHGLESYQYDAACQTLVMKPLKPVYT